MKRKFNCYFILLLICLILCNCSVSIDSDLANTVEGSKIINSIVFQEFISFLLPFISGFLCLIGGFVLTVLGFSGHITWIVEMSGFTSKLINATPGILLMVLGTLIILSKKYNVKIQKESAQTKKMNSWKIAFFILLSLFLFFLLILFLRKMYIQ